MAVFLAALSLCIAAALSAAALPRQWRVPCRRSWGRWVSARLRVAMSILITGDVVTLHSAQVYH